MSNSIKSITLFGSGNVATQLGLALNKAGVKITQVYSRNLDSAKILAEKLDSKGINKIEQLKDSDLGILAISDDAIKKFTAKLPASLSIVHTSGNTDLIERYKDSLSGVFYPLQTFSKEEQSDFSEIPICIEANNDDFLKRLFDLGTMLSSNVKIIDSPSRKIIHAAAVFACNFTNHMGALAEDILKSKNLDLSLLNPLLNQTFNNISKGNVKSKQTGPAMREDYGTINEHLSVLEENPEFKELYLTISKHIISYHHGQKL